MKNPFVVTILDVQRVLERMDLEEIGDSQHVEANAKTLFPHKWYS